MNIKRILEGMFVKKFIRMRFTFTFSDGSQQTRMVAINVGDRIIFDNDEGTILEIETSYVSIVP